MNSDDRPEGHPFKCSFEIRDAESAQISEAIRFIEALERRIVVPKSKQNIKAWLQKKFP